MKIAVRGGHCPCIPGASKFVDELTEDRKVTESVIKYLKQLGHEVFNVTPPDDITTSVGDLSFGVIKANTYKVDLFVSIHFNKAYNIYNGDLGSEVCVYCPFDTAQRVVNGLAYLGFKNRGQKVRTNLYELKHTSMKAMIIEVCFVESTGDVSLYKRLGHDLVGKTIAESIADKKVSTSETAEQKLNSFNRLFSDNWYLTNYPDVRRSEEYKNNPYKHYIATTLLWSAPPKACVVPTALSSVLTATPLFCSTRSSSLWAPVSSDRSRANCVPRSS